LPTLGAPAWISRAIILIFAFGFIPTIILSWVYELTPEGIKREHEVVRDESITEYTAKRLDYVTIAAVIAGIIFFAFFSAKQSSNGPTAAEAMISEASVAVLPFENLSPNADHEYFSNGLTETILHMLAQIPDLKVAARTSSFAFRDQNLTIQEIASALEVAHVLEGSVQRDGDQVRITAQLIRADDGFHVWSENYDRTLDDIFGIQDEIAEKVGGALSVSLLGTSISDVMAGINTRSPDAYDMYLQAISERDKFSHGGLMAAEGLLKGALTIDPDFLDAKTELANNYLQQANTGLKDTSDAYAAIMAITDQVLAVSPDDVAARAVQIYTEWLIATFEGGPVVTFDAIEQLEQLVDEDPTQLQARIYLTRLYQLVQQNEQSLPLMLEARELDPFNAQIHYELSSIYTRLEQWDDARAALKTSLELEPSQPNAYGNLATLSMQTGDGLDFLQQFLKAVEVDPVDHELPGIIAIFLYNLELVEEGDDFRNRVMAIAPTSEISYRIELLRAMAMGDEEAGIVSARRAIENDVNNRQFAYGGAAQYLLRVAAARGTVAEESAYLEEHAPGILDIDALSVPQKYRTAQITAFDAWYTTLPKDELNRRIDVIWTVAATFGVDLAENDNAEFGTLALRGEVDKATEVALDRIFSEPVTLNLNWEETFKQAQYAEIVEDPRIQAAMKKWQDEEDALREQVRTFLADLSTKS
jgi:TolB-like protein/Tfp pilus assembly protein PilF